jgi:hypothetical protein
MEVEARVSASTSGGNTRVAQASMAAAWRCSIITPLGRPVDPDV